MNKINTTQIQEAVALLQAGELVALPTETVYGLGAHARHPGAIRKIFLAKERPFTHPLIVHLASAGQLSAWAREIPASALKLAQAFWPGPLTLILKKQPEVSELLTGGQDTIGLRIPAHPIAQALLQAFGEGIAAPSANRYTHLSPTTSEAVREELGTKVSCILEGGICEIGIESTIMDLSGEQPVILRPGMISAAQLEQVLGQPLGTPHKNLPRAPGMDKLHYAPETKVVLVEDLSYFLSYLDERDLPLALLTQQEPSTQLPGLHWIRMSKQPQQYAHDLYLTLRALDKQGFKKILIETLSLKPEWDAIRDRLEKASAA